MPWARLWPFLRNQIGIVSNTGEIDVARCVSLVARQKPLLKLPRRRIKHWPAEVHCLLDRSPELKPFYHDMDMVVRNLTDMCGKHRVKKFVLPSGITQKGFLGDTDNLISYSLPLRDISLLALTDLGFYRDEQAALTAWSGLGKTAIQRNSRVTALIPCIPDMWRLSVFSSWRRMYWDRGKRAENYRFSNIAEHEYTNEDIHHKTVLSRDARLKRFLALLSPLIRREPELVRQLRYLLPIQETDVSMEVLRPSFLTVAGELREVFKTLPLSVKKEFVNLLCGYHERFPEILAMEHAVLKAVDAEFITENDMKSVRCFQGNLVKTLNDRNWRYCGFSESEIMEWFYRMEKQLPDAAYKDERIAAAWVMAHKTVDGRLDTEDIPRELSMEKVAWALSGKEFREYGLYRSGSDLVAISSEVQNRENIFLGVTFSSTMTAFVSTTETSGKKEKRVWDLRVPLEGLFDREENSRQLDIESSFGVMGLKPISRLEWAKGMGNDDRGLYVKLSDERSLFWHSPGRYSFKLKGTDVAINLETGFWWDEAGFFDWQQNTFGNLDWADDAGIDEHGIYADFSVEKVKQRMRWVWPGTFMMGSPESEPEPERFDNEKQHEVTISEGFWLAETTCTQALWQAIMGENPSNFKGGNLPVETVSWEDCQKFIQVINRRKSGLELRLPSEAEWEYACRAGTVTPFSFGDNITTGQVNYNGEYPYNNAEKGEKRGKTVAVKSLPCNAWGLYEMHGNVWEWCSDWYGEYPAGAVVDPVGPETGTPRVLRGGSWLFYARVCRSAYRCGYEPGDRDNGFGFRLARGQKEQGPGSGPGEGWTADERSERRSTPSKERGGDGGNWLKRLKGIFNAD